MDREHIGFKVYEVGRLLRKAVGKKQMESGTDPIVLHRGWIIGYILHNEEEVICQKDLECIFHMPKSTATDTISVLENEGLLERVAVESDARKKRIVITDKGREFSRLMEDAIDEVEDYVIRDIPKEQMDIFYDVLNKIKTNATNYKNNGQKEE